ncbi:MAG: HK97 family phage prohead protease [Pseudomonadota bacterium]
MTVEPVWRRVERKFAGVTIEDVEADGAFSGYASLFGKVDLARDAVEPGAFRKTLRHRGPESVRMLFQHDPNQPIGRWTQIREDARGLFVRGRLTPGVARAQEVLRLMRAGALDGLSIGFRTVRARKDAGTGVRRILEADLWEISVVTFPMLPEARIDRVKGTGPAGMTRLRQDIARLLRGEAAAMNEARLAERFRRTAQTLQQEEDRIA